MKTISIIFFLVTIMFFSANALAASLIFSESFESLDSIKKNGGDFNPTDSTFEKGIVGNALHTRNSEFATFPINGVDNMKQGTIEFLFKTEYKGEMFGILELGSNGGFAADSDQIMGFVDGNALWSEIGWGGQYRENFSNNEWHHAALVWRCGEGNDGFAAVYIDGKTGSYQREEQCTKEEWMSEEYLKFLQPLTLTIGSTTHYMYIAGETVFDELTVYNYARTEQQIGKDYANYFGVSIGCWQNSDCGTDGWIENQFCQDGNVFQKYKTFTCQNPATKLATCAEETISKQKNTCSYSCANGTCIESKDIMTLYCPQNPIADNYSFSFDKGKYGTVYLQFDYANNFKKPALSIKGTSPVSITKYYKNLISIEGKSQNKTFFARLYSSDKKGKYYSNVCEIKLAEPVAPTINCPTETIGSDYSFAWNSGSYTKTVNLELSYENNFKHKTSFSAIKTNLALITKYYKTLIGYETKTTNKQLYARITATDSYKRTGYSNVCEFKLKEPVAPILNCPTEPIDSNYNFAWNFGDYQKTVNLEFSYETSFKHKTSINTIKTNPLPVKKYWKTLTTYAAKSTDKKIFARIYATDNFGRKKYSENCTFSLK